MRKIKVGDYVQLFNLLNSEIHGCSRHENGDPKRITKILVDSVEDSTLKVMVEGSETAIWVSYRDCNKKGLVMEKNRTGIVEGKRKSNIREVSNRPAPIKPPTFGKAKDSESIWTPAITTEDVPANQEFVLGNSSLWAGPMICYFGGDVWWRDDGTELAHPPQEWISFDRIFSATGK